MVMTKKSISKTQPTSARTKTIATTPQNVEEHKRARLLQENINNPEEQIEGQLALDIYQTATDLVIVAPIAGVKMSDINVTVTEDVLTIKGKRYLEFDIPEQDYFTQECFWGDFSRSIVLPSAVDTTKILASFKDAVLKISIPRTERSKTKVVRIKTE